MSVINNCNCFIDTNFCYNISEHFCICSYDPNICKSNEHICICDKNNLKCKMISENKQHKCSCKQIIINFFNKINNIKDFSKDLLKLCDLKCNNHECICFIEVNSKRVLIGNSFCLKNTNEHICCCKEFINFNYTINSNKNCYSINHKCICKEDYSPANVFCRHISNKRFIFDFSDHKNAGLNKCMFLFLLLIIFFFISLYFLCDCFILF